MKPKMDFYLVIMTAKFDFISNRASSCINGVWAESKEIAETWALINVQKGFPKHKIHVAVAKKVGLVQRILFYLLRYFNDETQLFIDASEGYE